MKTENKEQRKERLKSLIAACLYRYSESEIVEVFNSITGTDYIDESEIEEEEKMSEFDMTNELVAKGYCIFKPSSSYQADQLKEYAETNIFRYCNEQKDAILF